MITDDNVIHGYVMVEHHLRQAHEHLQRRQDQEDEIVTNTLKMMRLHSELRAQLDDLRQSRDYWRERAQTAKRLLAKAKAKTKATNGAAT
jgi:hypothetical protein